MSEPLPLGATVPARAATSDARHLWRAERSVYLGLAIAISAAVVLGFARTFFFRPWYPESALILDLLLRMKLAATGAWLAFAGWAVSLVGR